MAKVNEEIIGGLMSALSRGEGLEKAMMTFYNAGYEKEEIEDSAKDVYNKSGMKVIFDWLIELQLKKPEPNPLMIAGWYTNLDKKDEALNWLENAFEKHISRIPRINNNPDFDNLRSEPRFQAMIKKMGLSGYQKRQ